ncbi:MAG: glycosyltransferase family 4 protein [Clostridia bacterium]|nr:glycosyltransferase family 4 protein [Clostridia bacterium]
MSHIIFVGNYSLGMYRFRGDLISALLAAGQRVTVLLPDAEYADEIKSLGASLVMTPMDRRGMNPFRDLSLLSFYKKTFRELRPDAVVTYTIKPNIYAGRAAASLGIPFVANITGLGTAFEKPGPLRTLVTLMYRSSLKRAGRVFFENSVNRQIFIERRIVREEQTVLLGGAGVNTEVFPLQPFSVRDKTDDSRFRFLFIGRVMREKGIDELLRAMRILRDRGVGCVLDIVGITEEDYKAEFAEASAEGWLCDRGFQKDVRPFIAGCDCFVLPSWHEGMANTNLEASSSGRPVITTDIPGCREEVVPGITGWLVPPKDAGALADAMEQAARLDAEKLRAMGREGRRYVTEHFDKRAVVAETVGVINELIKRN